jgi:ADP-ribosylglycohydrolase
MALATLDSLKKGRVDYNEIMDNFVMWLSNDDYTPTGEAFDVGRTCLTAIRNYCRKGAPPALECGLTDEQSNGNGSLMRIHPAALFLYKYKDKNEAVEIIHKLSAITHAHERSKIACGIYAFLLWELLSGDRKFGDKATIRRGISKARKYYVNNPEFEHYAYKLCRQIADIDHIWEDPDKYKRAERNDIRSTGYVVDTLEAAVWCLYTTNSYKECVLKAVNLGDDTDTVAAIAGGLAGAMYGLDAIPAEWLEKLKKKDYIEKMCEEACNCWENMI